MNESLITHEEQVRRMKAKEQELLAELRKWLQSRALKPECEDARKKVEIYNELCKRIKSEIKYSRRRARKPAAQPKGRWSPVLSGSFESGKRR